MFSKRNKEDSPSLASPPKIGEALPIRKRNVSVIGPTLVFRGELSADEDLVIEGMIEGKIAHHKKHLTIGKQGRVKADLHAMSVIVEGKVEGDIYSDGVVRLAKGSDVSGNIQCARIQMEQGAHFNGKIRMEEPATFTVNEDPEPVAAPKPAAKAVKPGLPTESVA